MSHNKRAFKRHPESEARKRSAVFLIEYLLPLKNHPEVWVAHFDELLDVLLWKITEAEARSKHRTRFQSQGAISCGDKSKLRHDHVCPKAKMIVQLKQAEPNEVPEILKSAIACTVTAEEHSLLSGDGYGWERYRNAGIVVINTETDEPVAFQAPVGTTQSST